MVRTAGQLRRSVARRVLGGKAEGGCGPGRGPQLTGKAACLQGLKRALARARERCAHVLPSA
jgi:hypothetical protein